MAQHSPTANSCLFVGNVDILPFKGSMMLRANTRVLSKTFPVSAVLIFILFCKEEAEDLRPGNAGCNASRAREKRTRQLTC